MEVVLVYRKFAGDLGLAGCGEFLKSLRTIIVIPILAKLLGAEDYGIWVQIKVTAGFLTPLVLLGLSGSMVRFLGGELQVKRIQKGFNSSVYAVALFGLVVAVLLFFFSKPLARMIFKGPESYYFVQIGALFVLFDALDQLAMAYFQTFRRMVMRSYFLLLEILVELGIVGSLAVAGYSLATIMMFLVGWKCIIVLLKLGRIWSQIGLSLPSFSALGPYVSFGFPLVFSNLFYFLVNYGDRYLINAFLSVRDVGIYSVAYAIGSLPIILMAPIDYVLYPTIAGSWNRGGIEEVRKYIEQSLKLALLIIIPVAFGITVLSAPIISLLSTREFLPARSAVPMIAFAFLIYGIGVVGERVLLLANRPRLITLLYGGLASLNILLNLILIPRIGILGAAIATLLTFGSYTVFTLSFSYRYCRIEVDFRFLCKSIFAGLLMAAMIRRLHVSSLPGLIGSVLAGGGAYFAILLLLKSFAPQEIGFFRNLVAAMMKGRAMGRVR